MTIKRLKSSKTFEGDTCFYEHASSSTKTTMKFSTYEPKGNGPIENCIIWLSGLTCTDENFITKAGAQEYLSGTTTMILCPDTSPRGLNLDGEHDGYDFGSGAGFYVNATTPGYKDHYRMYDYIVSEIVDILKSQFGVKNISIMGHSMGGHGALVMGLRNKDIFKSVSAFSPIVNPINCPWGQKALKGYLGDNSESWKEYDAVELIRSSNKREDTLLVDQGLADEFLKEQLLSKNLEEICREKNQSLEMNYRDGYDHSYYFISTFIENHIKFHLKHF